MSAWIRDKQWRLATLRKTFRASDRPLKLFAALALKRSGLCRLLTIQRDGFQLRFYPSSISYQIWLHPESSPWEFGFVRRVLRPGDTFIDVGANIGEFTLTGLTAVGPAGKVVAIEAHPRIFDFLQGNLRLNAIPPDRYTALNVAVGERQSQVYFSDGHDDDINHLEVGAAGVPVEMRRLDTLPLPPGAITLLKVDVEGYERYVLEGASGMIDRVECILIEYSDQNYAQFGYDQKMVTDALHGYGFSLLRWEADGLVAPYEPVPAAVRFENVIAVRDVRGFCSRNGFSLRADSGVAHA